MASAALTVSIAALAFVDQGFDAAVNGLGH